MMMMLMMMMMTYLTALTMLETIWPGVSGVGNLIIN